MNVGMMYTTETLEHAAAAGDFFDEYQRQKCKWRYWEITSHQECARQLGTILVVQYNSKAMDNSCL